MSDVETARSRTERDQRIQQMRIALDREVIVKTASYTGWKHFGWRNSASPPEDTLRGTDFEITTSKGTLFMRIEVDRSTFNKHKKDRNYEGIDLLFIPKGCRPAEMVDAFHELVRDFVKRKSAN